MKLFISPLTLLHKPFLIENGLDLQLKWELNQQSIFRLINVFPTTLTVVSKGTALITELGLILNSGFTLPTDKVYWWSPFSSILVNSSERTILLNEDICDSPPASSIALATVISFL